MFLSSQHWPLTNSDEATLGLMSMHIQRGELPIFYYGQNYMGALEAYLGAGFFSLFGASEFTLRLVTTLLFILFLLSMYLLTRTLYTKNLAFFTMLLLSLGSKEVLLRELFVIGGYVETILFASLAFLLASWLALSPVPPAGSPKKRIARLTGYGAWGLVIGLGLWSDLLLLPFVACSTIVLLLFCWRELARGAIIPLLIGLVLGAFPLLVYNLGAAHGQDSWSVLIAQQEQHIHHSLSLLEKQISSTVDSSIPIITGSPFCHATGYLGLPFLPVGSSGPSLQSCTLISRGWSIVYLLLFAVSAVLTVVALAKSSVPFRFHGWTPEKRPEIVRLSIQLLLLAGALLTLMLYVRSQAPIISPTTNSRYLIGLWIATPAVLWPLWRGACILQQSPTRSERMALWLTNVACRGFLLILLVLFLLGTCLTFTVLPSAQLADQQDHALVDGLLKAGITHIYSEYWTCDLIVFESKEKIICGVVNHYLYKSSNRYDPYYVAVSKNPNSSYAFPTRDHLDAIIEKKLQQEGRTYRRFILAGYTVYQPL